MSSFLCDPPGSVQGKVRTTAYARQAVRHLAYCLWIYRGSPIGSPELDWAESERLLSGSGYYAVPCLPGRREEDANGFV